MALSRRIENARRRFAQRAMRLVFHTESGPPPVRERLPVSGIHRILICRTVHTLGDSLTLTPLLQELSRTFPGAEIDIISRCAVAGSIYGTRFSIGRIIRLPRHMASHPIRTLHALQQMRQIRYDLVIDPDPQSQSGRLLTLLSRKTWSLGFVGPCKSGRVTHGVAVPDTLRHKGKAPVFLLRSALGNAAPEQADYPRLDIRLSDLERRQGREALAQLVSGRHPPGQVCVGLFVNASGGKLLGNEWWDRFLRTFESSTADCTIVEILPATGESRLASRYPCFYSCNVRKMASVIANLSLFVSTDCGVMHLASATGVPTVGIFTITDASEWGPYGGANRAIDARNLAPEQVATQVLATFHALHTSEPFRPLPPHAG